LVAVVTFAVNTLPWVAMTLVLAMLVAIGAIEHFVMPPIKSAAR
jgi:hypothetical protein